MSNRYDINNQTRIENSTASSSTTTGALTVAGGVGISGNTYIGGNSVISGNVGVGITPTQPLHVSGNILCTGNIIPQNSKFSLSTNGYTVLSGGLLLQWGSFTGGNSSTQINGTVTFPVAYSSAPYSITATPTDTSVNNSNNSNGGAIMVNTFTSTTFNWSWKQNTASIYSPTVYWMSIGPN